MKRLRRGRPSLSIRAPKTFRPRIYSVEFICGKRLVSMMLGIAANVNDRQRFYEAFRHIARWNQTARFRSERLYET